MTMATIRVIVESPKFLSIAHRYRTLSDAFRGLRNKDICFRSGNKLRRWLCESEYAGLRT